MPKLFESPSLGKLLVNPASYCLRRGADLICLHTGFLAILRLLCIRSAHRSTALYAIMSSVQEMLCFNRTLQEPFLPPLRLPLGRARIYDCRQSRLSHLAMSYNGSGRRSATKGDSFGTGGAICEQ